MHAPSTASRLAFLSSVSLLALVGALTNVACSESSDGSPTGGDDTDASIDGGAEAAACANEGTGSIAIVVTGLPEGIDAKITLTTPSGAEVEVTAGATLADQPAGTYAVSAARAAQPDPIVRTVYEASASSFCLEATQTQTVTVAYTPVATSHKLWSTNGTNPSGQLLGFAAASLGATGTPSATVAAKGAGGAASAAGKAAAFDKEGNLWSLGATTADAPILRFAAADLGASGDKTADRKIVPKLSGCLPGPGAIAFAPDGALWATVPCENQLLRLSPDTLSASKQYTPVADDLATGSTGPRAVAFDKDGNMWVSDDTSLRRYAAASLAPGQAHVPDFEIKAKAENDNPLPPDALAFDKDGNLWTTSFGGNVIYKVTPAELTPDGASREILPSVAITVSVGALLESIAFDESGGLWLTYSQGKIARLAPDQLSTSTTGGDPTIPTTIVTSADIGYAGGMAFFPAPAALPLYSRFE
ncbi:MAG: SMP-30/gluconolactonase/LRE family protein [Labilithrix sp.]|nr:SMP-30/gluconolactonase/LRE family protein [Labilithrix sp.]MBX3225482.1 SMP-30/gluconolactonase/LRE family protein [Labilithrix sp.]